MSTFLNGKERTFVALTDATRTEKIHLDLGALGRPNVDPPDIVIQDNVELYAFTVGTDRVFFTWDVPEDYAGGDLSIQVEWTNDGGVDDQNKDVKVQLDYQTAAAGDSLAGSHANSPKTLEDTYTSASGWIFYVTDLLTIAEADFAVKHSVDIKLSFVAPAGVALTAEPHLKGLQVLYIKYVNQ